MPSYANVQTNKMNLGPMRVTYDGNDLGGTLDNVEMNFKYMKAEIKADQSGETVRDRRISGVEITVKTSLVQTEEKDKWKVAFPNATLIEQGGQKAIFWQQQVGASDLAAAKVLKLHPLAKLDADLSGDFTFFKAVASEESPFLKGPTEQDKLEVLWNILPDDSVVPERFFIHGDPNIGVQNAGVSQSAYSGTGDGTLGSLAIAADWPYTETISVKCVGEVSDAGNFLVTGSQSGPLGMAQVGVAFNSSGLQGLSFTIADGSTDFDIDDEFTLSATGSNWS